MDKHGYVSVDQLIALREKEFGKTTSLARRQFQYYRWIMMDVDGRLNMFKPTYIAV